MRKDEMNDYLIPYRPGPYTINLYVYERQREEEREARRRWRELDPFDLGLYGPTYEEGA